MAQSSASPPRLIPFPVFLQNLKRTSANSYVSQSGYRVKDSAEFERMRHHLLALYSGVHVKQSYLADSQTVDCVPVGEQPALRGSHEAATPPPSSDANPKITSGCESGTIPMRRLTVEELARFSTLEDYRQKIPGEPGSTRK